MSKLFDEKALDTAKKAANEKHAALESYRGELEEKGISIAEDDKAAERLGELHGEWKASADEVNRLRDLWELSQDVGGARTASNTDGFREEKRETPSYGQQFIDSDGFKSYKATGRSGEVELKATDFAESTSGTSLTAYPWGATVVPGVLQNLYLTPRVADLLMPGQTDGNTIWYVQETSNTDNAAAAVAERGEKQASTLDVEMVEETVKKIATILNVADEMLDDWAQVRSYIDGRLRTFIALAEDASILKGAGGNDLSGLLNRSGLESQAVGSETYGKIATAVRKARTKIELNFQEPDGIVFHPNDWEAAQLEADANGQFFAGGPFMGPYGQNGIAGERYWGYRVVVTPQITEGTALLGAYASAAQLFRRGGITIEVTNAHSTNFAFDISTLRAETRVGLAVYRPDGFAKITSIP